MAEEHSEPGHGGAPRSHATSEDHPGARAAPQRVEFTRRGLREGFVACVPVALGVAGLLVVVLVGRVGGVA